ncbi:MAG: ABC transporter permease [Gemmatimonadota bacterium]|nr:ABC transporter permease [Gemmatimonadota bacterium]
MSELWETLAANRGEILLRTWEHLGLVGVSVFLATLIGVPAGVWLTRRPGARGPVLGGVNVIQTIPSLALLGFLIPVPWLGGLGARPAIVALVAYALLPIVKNTYEGIRAADPAAREAGEAMGMTDLQILRQIELPLGLGVILGGIRLATVIGIGVATIAAFIGAGGLGALIFRGISMVDSHVILAGAIPAALLALVADRGLGALERRFSRWSEE